MNRRTVLAGAVVIGLAASLLLLAGCEEEDVAGLFGAGNVTASETEMLEVPADLPLSLNVESSNGALSVHGVDGVQTASVVVTTRSRGETLEEAQDRVDRIVYRVSQTGQQLELIYRASEQDDDVRRFSGVDFDVIVPMETRVNAETSNGAIEVTAIRGTITLDTSNGDVDVRQSDGDLHAETSNGRIEVVDFAGDIRADTSNGEVWIEDATGLVDVETSNGSIHYSGVPAEGAGNRLRTSNGSITARVPSASAILFEARVSTGKIRTSLPLAGDTEGDEWSAALNPPTATTFDLRTSNGSIRIEGIP